MQWYHLFGLQNNAVCVFVIPCAFRLLSPKRYTGSCNDKQTVMVKMSSFYGIFQVCIARISREYAIESSQSVHVYDVYCIVRSFPHNFGDLESSIE